MARLILVFFALSLVSHYVSAGKMSNCGPNEILERCARRCEPTCDNQANIPCRAIIPKCPYECGCESGFRRSEESCVEHCPAQLRD